MPEAEERVLRDQQAGSDHLSDGRDHGHRRAARHDRKLSGGEPLSQRGAQLHTLTGTAGEPPKLTRDEFAYPMWKGYGHELRRAIDDLDQALFVQPAQQLDQKLRLGLDAG